MNLSSLSSCLYTGWSLRKTSLMMMYCPRLSGYISATGPELLTVTTVGTLILIILVIYKWVFKKCLEQHKQYKSVSWLIRAAGCWVKVSQYQYTYHSFLNFIVKKLSSLKHRINMNECTETLIKNKKAEQIQTLVEISCYNK